MAPSNAILSFDEICLVEPGNPGSVFGDGDFWDYVIVEGTEDGCTWVPLLDGYDARADSDWLDAYDLGQSGDPSLFRNRQINLLDTFGQGTQILIRFRMFSDGSVNGWGWCIDNLSIQPGPTSTGDTPARFALEQNHPNPFNPRTDIRYALPTDGDVNLRVFDMRGRLVNTLVAGPQLAGRHSVTWDGTDQHGTRVASGIYLYRIESGDFVQQRKMTLVK